MRDPKSTRSELLGSGDDDDRESISKMLNTASFEKENGNDEYSFFLLLH